MEQRTPMEFVVTVAFSTGDIADLPMLIRLAQRLNGKVVKIESVLPENELPPVQAELLASMRAGN